MNKPFFRTALGGYNKSDVNEYILQKSREHDEVVGNMEKAFSEEREALIRQRDYAVSKAEEEKAQLSEKLADAEIRSEKLEEVSSRLMDCTSRLENITAAAFSLRKKAEMLSELSNELSLSVSGMRSTLDEIRTTEEKAKKMDRFTALFSEMFSSSDSKASSGESVPSDFSLRDESLAKAEELIARLDTIREETERLIAVIGDSAE
ncbi:MAG: hypothetical protein E7665_09300 [Ruminococcaceae bacterium]|nr:hypothetical protein [Oscillospiraceae bacterium]